MLPDPLAAVVEPLRRRVTEVLISLVGWDTYLLAIGIPPKFYALVVSFEYRCRYIGDLLRITSRSVGTITTTGRLTAQSPSSSNGVITSTSRMVVASLIQIIRSFVAKRGVTNMSNSCINCCEFLTDILLNRVCCHMSQLDNNEFHTHKNICLWNVGLLRPFYM